MSFAALDDDDADLPTAFSRGNQGDVRRARKVTFSDQVKVIWIESRTTKAEKAEKKKHQRKQARQQQQKDRKAAAAQVCSQSYVPANDDHFPSCWCQTVYLIFA